MAEEHKIYQSRLIQKHDTEANWNKATNFVPLKGEIIIYDDLNQMKIGDGGTVVSDLPFIIPTVPTKLSELVDDKILWVKFSALSGSNITLDKTYNEIKNAYNNQQLIIGYYRSRIIEFAGAQQSILMFKYHLSGSTVYNYILNGAEKVEYSTINLQKEQLITAIDETASGNTTSYPSVKAVIDYVGNNSVGMIIKDWSESEE